MSASKRPTQRSLVQETLFGVETEDGTVATRQVVDEALATDLRQYGGDVFHGTQTPRASVRRSISDLVTEGLVIRGDKGILRFRVDGLVDTVVQGDVLELLHLVPDNSLPIVHADPAWTYMEQHTSKGTTTRMLGRGMRWFKTGNLPKKVIKEVVRTLKPGGVFMVWLPPLQEAAIKQWYCLIRIVVAGLTPLREVTWDKECKGSGYGWAPGSEPCFIFYKKKRPRFYDLRISNILRHPRLSVNQKTTYTDFTPADAAAWKAAKNRYKQNKKIPYDVRAELREQTHGCEKPVAMLMDLLKPVLVGDRGRAGAGDDLVMDLYSGSGAASVAAARLGAHFCSVEHDPRNVDHLIVPRLQGSIQRTIILEATECR